MKILLWFCVLVHCVFAQLDFGTSYLTDASLCKEWACISNKLGLPHKLPHREQMESILQSLLPEGPWQYVANVVLDGCYGQKSRKYTNTCPGQAILHCVVDNLINNCPEGYQHRSDACAPISSLAGFKHMFAQSRYPDLESHIPADPKPAWFLRNYYNTKCCDVPELFNTTVLADCGFSAFINTYTFETKTTAPTHTWTNTYTVPGRVQVKPFKPSTSSHMEEATTTQRPVLLKNATGIEDVMFYAKPSTETTTTQRPVLLRHATDIEDLMSNPMFDPLDCCRMDFIQPIWRKDCDFGLRYSNKNRLIFPNMTVVPTTASTTTKPSRAMDVRVTPLTCQKSTCIFKKLNIITDSGTVNIDGFKKLLDNMTNIHPEWTKAKARVFTTCLSKPIKPFYSGCEINTILACTFDVLSENCPRVKKVDPCKHSPYVLNLKQSRNISTCQISSSNRPKNRRQFCALPRLVDYQVLSECGATSLSQTEFVPEPVLKHFMFGWSNPMACKALTEPTKCVLSKMGVLNKYNFIDYISMKKYISNFTSQNPEWAHLNNVCMSSFTISPMYTRYCSSPRKLLNVIDTLLSTCAPSRRKDNEQCKILFSELDRRPSSAYGIRGRNVWEPFKSTTKGPELQKTTEKTDALSLLKQFGVFDFNKVGPVRVLNIPTPAKEKIDPVRVLNVPIPAKHEIMEPLPENTPKTILPVYLRNSPENPILPVYSRKVVTEQNWLED